MLHHVALLRRHLLLHREAGLQRNSLRRHVLQGRRLQIMQVHLLQRHVRHVDLLLVERARNVLLTLESDGACLCKAEQSSSGGPSRLL